MLDFGVAAHMFASRQLCRSQPDRWQGGACCNQHAATRSRGAATVADVRRLARIKGGGEPHSNIGGRGARERFGTRRSRVAGPSAIGSDAVPWCLTTPGSDCSGAWHGAPPYGSRDLLLKDPGVVAARMWAPRRREHALPHTSRIGTMITAGPEVRRQPRKAVPAQSHRAGRWAGAPGCSKRSAGGADANTLGKPARVVQTHLGEALKGGHTRCARAVGEGAQVPSHGVWLAVWPTDCGGMFRRHPEYPAQERLCWWGAEVVANAPGRTSRSRPRADPFVEELVAPRRLRL